jgi:hypothetical protein
MVSWIEMDLSSWVRSGSEVLSTPICPQIQQSLVNIYILIKRPRYSFGNHGSHGCGSRAGQRGRGDRFLLFSDLGFLTVSFLNSCEVKEATDASIGLRKVDKARMGIFDLGQILQNKKLN